MDYTNFVRTYYTVALNKLRQNSEYNGSIVDFYYDLEIPEEQKHNVKETNSFLPDYDLNINTKTEYLEKFMEYYGTLYSDLGSILLDKEKLVSLYNTLIVNADDEAIFSAISLYVNAGIDYLKEVGVLS